jgi:hypothetical protein
LNSAGTGGECWPSTSSDGRRATDNARFEALQEDNIHEWKLRGLFGSSDSSDDPVTDTYSYVWKTNKDWAGTCRVFTLKLDDGTAHTVTSQFTK